MIATMNSKTVLICETAAYLGEYACRCRCMGLMCSPGVTARRAVVLVWSEDNGSPQMAKGQKGLKEELGLSKTVDDSLAQSSTRLTVLHSANEWRTVDESNGNFLFNVLPALLGRSVSSQAGHAFRPLWPRVGLESFAVQESP